MDESGDFPPKNDESADVGRRLLKIIERVYVRTGGVREPNSPEFHAEEVFKIVSALRQSKQLYRWPGASEEEQTFREGQELYLAYLDDQGNYHVSQEPIVLPKYPSSFIDGLEAFIAGQDWSIVKEKIAADPNLKGKEIAESLLRNVDQARSFRDLKLIAETMNAGLSKKLQSDVLFRLETKIQRYVETLAKQCSSVEELRRLRADADAFFQSIKDDSISPLGVYDALDNEADQLARRLFSKVTNLKDLDQTVRDFKRYTFSFEDLYRARIAAMANDTRTKLSFTKEMRSVKGEADLHALHERIATQVFENEELGESYRAELLARLGAKRSN